MGASPQTPRPHYVRGYILIRWKSVNSVGGDRDMLVIRVVRL